MLEPLLRKKAKGQTGGVSIAYFLMITPMMCGADWGLDTMHPRLGYYIFGGLNPVLLAGASMSCVRHLQVIFQKPWMPRLTNPGEVSTLLGADGLSMDEERGAEQE